MISSLDPMLPEPYQKPNCENDSDSCTPRLVLETYVPFAWCDTHDCETKASFAREILYNWHFGRD